MTYASALYLQTSHSFLDSFLEEIGRHYLKALFSFNFLGKWLRSSSNPERLQY